MKTVTNERCYIHTLYHSVKGIVPKKKKYVITTSRIMILTRATLNKLLHNSGLICSLFSTIWCFEKTFLSMFYGNNHVSIIFFVIFHGSKWRRKMKVMWLWIDFISSFIVIFQFLKKRCSLMAVLTASAFFLFMSYFMVHCFPSNL